MRLPDLLGRRRRSGDDPLDPELENLFLRSSRVPIPQQRELMRACSRVGTALSQSSPAARGLPRRLGLIRPGPVRWNPALGGAVAVVVLMLAAAFAAIATTSDRASASFQEEVEALAAATRDALADNEFDEAERADLSDRIAALVAELDSATEALAALDTDQLSTVAADLSEVREALASHDDDTGESAAGLSILIVSVTEAVVSEAAAACSDAESRDGVEACRSAVHSGAGACAELGDEACKDSLEQTKDDAEQRYEARKHDAESAVGCEDIAARDAELGTACAEIIEDVEAECDGTDNGASFAECREAFRDAKGACEALGEFAYQGCKGAAEAVKDAADADESDVEPVSDCSELTDPELASSCRSVIDGVTAACSDVRSDEDRNVCQQAFHDGKDACESLGEQAYEACKDEIEELKDAAERDWEERKLLAEQAANCSEVAALDSAAGAECSAVAAAVAIACEGDREACHEAFQLAKAQCQALGARAAKGCKSEIESLKNLADGDAEEKAAKLSPGAEADGDGKGRGRDKPKNGHSQGGNKADDGDPEHE